MPSLVVDNVVKNYGAFRAIKGVSLAVEEGEFLVMVGPSGCGKSTLLRAIAGLETISSGRVKINGRDVTREEPANRGVAMVFQNYALYPHMTVRQNMGFALKVAGRPKAEIDAAVTRAAEILRIGEHLDKRPKQLSGGQKQRVAIGRAITRAPEVFLFDEPLSNLDAALRSQMRVELGRLHAELAATMVYVTHDQTEAMTMADRIVVLNGGRIEQIGAPLDLYNRPANRFVAGFLGSPRMNFITARARASSGHTVAVEVPGLPGALTLAIEPDAAIPASGDELIMGIRAENLRPGSGGALTVDARVVVVESLGRETLLYVDAAPLTAVDSESAEGYFAVHRPAQVVAGHGDRLSFAIPAEAVYLFDRDGNTLHNPSLAGGGPPPT
jgi:multiple sugar transport system ATP-binding protein